MMASIEPLIGEIQVVEEDEISSSRENCCFPTKPWYRFTGLIFMCFLGFGSYFCYDFPGALQNQIENDMDVSTIQFTSLYAFYSWPNVILSFLGGFVIDRYFGIPMGTIFFSTLLTIGHYIVSFGAYTGHFWIMQTGRVVFGVGGESLAVAQNAFAVSWFKGKELNMVFGILLSMARVGSTVNFLVMGPIYSWMSTYSQGFKTLGIALLIGGVTCVFSLLCALILVLMDRRRTNVLGLTKATTGDKVRLRDVLSFPKQFWLLCVICVTYYVAIFPFISLSKVFFMDKDGLSDGGANEISSTVYIISAFASPIFGFLVDKFGRNVTWVMASITTTTLCHYILAFTQLNPVYPMVLMGLSYSVLASSLWPMVSLIIPDSSLGTAYGLMQSVQNLGLAVITLGAGWIVDTHGYLFLEIFFIFWLQLAMLATIVIMKLDRPDDFGLNMTAKARAARIQPQEDESAVLAVDA